MRTTIDDLSERISIRYRAVARTERGDIIRCEEMERCKVWAKVLPISAPIESVGIERQASIHYRIVLRYRPDILPDDEVLWRGKRLTITNTPYDAESRHVWTVLECVEVMQDGAAQT